MHYNAPHQKPVIIANWKMNGTAVIIKDYLNYINVHKKASSHLILALPSIYLKEIQCEITEKNYQDIFIAAQDISPRLSGAYTGEISVTMLNDCNISYSIIGHSERRKYHNLMNQQIAEALQLCLQHQIKCIICVGENDINTSKTNDFLQNQLDEIFKNLALDSEIIIAYEPIWAIGSGIIPEVKTIEIKGDFICNYFAKRSFYNVKVLYGGSVDISNYESIVSCPSIAGVLVGKYCLNAELFCQMINSYVPSMDK